MKQLQELLPRLIQIAAAVTTNSSEWKTKTDLACLYLSEELAAA